MIRNFMYYALKNLLVFVLLCFLSGCESQAQTSKTEILWDNYGVPHIYAKNEKEMYYAFGWTQMNNHANLLLKLYAQARGCASEYWGKDYLESDKQILLFNLPEMAKNNYLQLEEEYKSYLDAFVNGIKDRKSVV
jgi:acyl-homoserine-lactone acylase